jgi:hypothetical protein
MSNTKKKEPVDHGLLVLYAALEALSISHKANSSLLRY